MMDMDGLEFYLVYSGAEEKKVLGICEKQIRGNLLSQHQHIQWLKPADCMAMDLNALKKNDVFIFTEFKGAAFEHIRSSPKKPLILGPAAVRHCFENQLEIPHQSPCIFNPAMYGLVVAFSGLNEKDKQKYSELVSFMGGLCQKKLPEMCTHLVANTVLSTKYESAVLNQIPVMSVEWIDQVWKKNSVGYVAATDHSFEAYKLPIFYNLKVATTSLSTKEKTKIEKLINGNGGTHYKTFKSNVVDILILDESGKGSEKYRCAVKYNKQCLTPQWIYESVKQGYSVSFKEYTLSGEVRVSTPKKNAQSNPEFSISQIHGSGNVTVDESVASSSGFSRNLSAVPEASETSPRDAQTDVDANYYKEALKQLNVTQAKAAGCFLDGCNIYFSGFTATELNKLNKIVNLSGTTRFDEIHDNVTHVIVGKRNEKELATFREKNMLIHFLKLDWLIESMRQKQPAKEEDHQYMVVDVLPQNLQPEPPSPASKKNIAAMNASFKKPLPIENNNAGPSSHRRSLAPQMEEVLRVQGDSLMNRYLASANMEPVLASTSNNDSKTSNNNATVTNTSLRKQQQHPPSRESHQSAHQSRLMHSTMDSDLDTDDYENLTFFRGKTFAIQQCTDREEYLQMVADIQNFGGTLVDKTQHREPVDYLVTPAAGLLNFKPELKAHQVVSNLWIEDVINARSEVPVQYYHHVISLRDDTIMEGICCTISTYGGTERIYLTLVCQSLGARVEEKYAKNSFPVLICEVPDGSKYKGAINWEYPVVTKEWVLDSYRRGYLHKLEEYLVGASVLSAKHTLFREINDRGILRNAEPPAQHGATIGGDQSLLASPEVSVIMSQTTPAVMAHKRKSGDLLDGLEEPDNYRPPLAGSGGGKHDKRFKSHQELGLLHHPQHSSTKNDRVMALRSESKSTTSPSTPISKHLKEMDFGYDTPKRKQLYDVLKETAGKTPHTPHTPAVMKMPTTPLHPDPDASPASQWNVIHKFSGFLDKKRQSGKRTTKTTTAKGKKQLSPGTPLSEIKKRFWQEALGDEHYNSTMLNLNSQTLEIDQNDPNESNVSAVASNSGSPAAVVVLNRSEEGAAELQGLVDFISKRKSAAKTITSNVETCPLAVEATQAGEKDKELEIMVGWTREGSPGTATITTTTTGDRSRSVSGSSAATGGNPEPYFLTSGIDCKETIFDKIKGLKAKFQTDGTGYESMCTHVICAKIARVEKVLCAVAAGKWILSIKYVEESAKAKKLLDEEYYQFGNPKAEYNMPDLSNLERAVASAAYSWRLKITDPTNKQYASGAFQGFRVLLHSKTIGFRRIIEAGGGVVLDVEDTLYRSDAGLAKTATLCLVDRKCAFPRDNYDFCQSHSIPVREVQYLNEYLLNDNATRKKSFEYRP